VTRHVRQGSRSRLCTHWPTSLFAVFGDSNGTRKSSAAQSMIGHAMRKSASQIYMSAKIETYHIWCITVVGFSGLHHRKNWGCCGLNGFVRVSSDLGENSSTLFYVNFLSTAFGICCYTDTVYALCKRKNI
jgi:hypothetical protein